MILKFLSRRAAAPTVDVAVAAAVAEPEKRTNAMADAWAAIAGAFQEVASDMHAVIVADEDEVKKKRLEEEKKADEEKKRLKQRVGIAKVIGKVNVKRSRSFAKKKISPSEMPKEEAHVEQPIAKVPTKDTATVKRSRSFAKKKISPSETQEKGMNEEQPMQSVIPGPTKFSRSLSMKQNSSSAPLAKPMKEISSLETTQEKETEAEQPTSSNTGMKDSHTAEIGNGVKNHPSSQTMKTKGSCATFTEPTKETNACEKKREVETITKQITKQPTSFTMEVKGSTDNLSKLMTKLDKKEKKLVKLKKKLNKAEVEAAETKESIDALTAKYNSFLYGDDDQSGDDGSSIWDDEQSDDDKQSQYGDDDQRQSDDESSICDDEESYDAIDTTFDFTSKSLMLISEKFNQAIYPGQWVWSGLQSNIHHSTPASLW